MKRFNLAKLAALLVLSLLLPLSAPAAAEESGSGGRAAADPEGLLREAFFEEVALSDPRAAAALYRQVLARPELPLRILALAHLRLGICLDLLSEGPEAEREFRAVVERHSGEGDLARLARRRLGEPLRNPARFMPPEIIFYAELVEPGQQAGFLSELIRGTPLENPVDSYLLARSGPGPAGGSPPSEAAPGGPELNQLRAILNLNALKELQKIEGVAFGAASGGDRGVEWLLVFLPGSSELSRLLIKAILPGAMDPAPPETVLGMTIFKLKKEPLHVALDEREEVVLLGSSRELLLEAIRRGSRAGDRGAAGERPSSLSEVDDFRRAQAARSGSLLFAYADREKAVAALRAGTVPNDLAAFDELRRLLGLDHLRAVGLTLARAGDDLRVTLRAQVDPSRHPLWQVLHTESLGGSEPPFVSPDSLIFFTTRAVDGERRWTALRQALAPLLSDLAQVGKGQELRSLLGFLDSELGMDFGRDLLGPLRALTVAVPSQLQLPPGLSFYLVLEFTDGDLAAPRLERLLEAVARKGLGPPEMTLVFQDEPARGEVKLRSARTAGGFRILYARRGAVFILSALPAVVEKALEGLREPPGAAGLRLPPLASKVLGFRPQALLRLGGPPEPRDPVDALLRHIPRLLFFTEEAPDGLALELRVPGATQAIRETLKELPFRLKPSETTAEPAPLPAGKP